MTIFNTSLTVSSNHLLIAYIGAMAFFEAKEYDKCITECDRALQVNKDYIEVWDNGRESLILHIGIPLEGLGIHSGI